MRSQSWRSFFGVTKSGAQTVTAVDKGFSAKGAVSAHRQGVPLSSPILGKRQIPITIPRSRLGKFVNVGGLPLAGFKVFRSEVDDVLDRRCALGAPPFLPQWYYLT
jgi:hypothetical protein